jgi:predicted  nucleic acid-binding Zn-ribbon protein
MSKPKIDKLHDDIGKYCVPCVTVFVGQSQKMYKVCPLCGNKVFDVKVVRT